MNSRIRLTAVLSLIALVAMLARQPVATAVPGSACRADLTSAVITAGSPTLSTGWLPSVSSVQAPAPGFSYVGTDDLPDRSARALAWSGYLASQRLMRLAGGLSNFPVRLRKAGLLFPFHDFW